ncbi:streptolysin associated protein SagE [Streptococcus phocae]|uniref:Streptolysin associated protein SagE n=2 Tax=Streptococcus phocae TaxID=119224 RepID=A0A0P6S5P6_9STRE|nr:streptolysin associated protein SagE [Streptococcus phocae]
MSMSILCLSLCGLLATLAPSIAMQAIFGKTASDYGFNLERFLKAINAYYGLVLLGIAFLSPAFFEQQPGLSMAELVISVTLILVVFVLEVGFLHALQCKKARRLLPLKLSFMGTSSSIGGLIGTLTLAAFEEVTYRWLWFGILLRIWHLPLILVILISTLCYALNHLLMGSAIFYSKLLTGLSYGIIYGMTMSIWSVLIVHVGGNLLVGGLSLYQARRRLQ